MVPASPGFSTCGSELVPITAVAPPAACSASASAAAPLGLSAPESASTAEAFSFGLAETPSETAFAGATRSSSGGRFLRASASARAAMRINVPLNSVKVFM